MAPINAIPGINHHTSADRGVEGEAMALSLEHQGRKRVLLRLHQSVNELKGQLTQGSINSRVKQIGSDGVMTIATSGKGGSADE